MHAELTLVLCSGGVRGKKQTYALLDEVVPVAESLSRGEALAELVRRYFTSHGPSTIADFTWWSSLTVADARRGLEAAGPEFASFVMDTETYWWRPSAAADESSGSPSVNLLQAFDEYGMVARLG